MKQLKIFLSKEFQKFLVVGGASTIINYGLFYILFQYEVAPYLTAAVIGYVVGLLFGYVFNRSWTFGSSNDKKVAEFTKYIGVYIFSLVASMLFLKFLVEVAGIMPQVSNVFAIGLSTVTNFVGCKLVVFAEKK